MAAIKGSEGDFGSRMRHAREQRGVSLRQIADATKMLSDAAARVVEERVLAAAGDMTTGMLRAALRRAVIAADPEGAERRRLVVLRKLGPTPEGFPRRSGMARKRPLA